MRSDYTDSLRDETDSPLKTVLLDQLAYAENRVDRGVESIENAYWQGRKDAMRIVIALYLNKPEVAEPIASSTFRDIAIGIDGGHNG